MFYLVDFLSTQAWEAASQDSSERPLQRGKGGAFTGYTGVLQQKPGSQNIKR